MNTDNREEPSSGEAPPRELIDSIKAVLGELLDQRLGPAGVTTDPVAAGTHADPVAAEETAGTTGLVASWSFWA